MKTDRMRRHRRLIPAALAAMVVLAPSASWAGCNQKNLAGVWWFYKHFFSSESPFTGWTRCRLVIDRKGNVAGGQPCIDFDGVSAPMREGGKLTVVKPKKKCNITGTLLFGGGGQETVTIEHAQMDDAGKKTFSGVGKDSFNFRFIFTAVQEGKRDKKPK